MTTLVTGASGGLGRVLCRVLRGGSAEEVVCVARRAVEEGEIIACDVTDAKAVRDLLGSVRPRLVYHLAGSFSNSYEIDYKVNALGARNVLEACEAHAPDARVVLMGSAAEYGIVHREENPVAEDRALRPVSIYGMTKAFQTQLASYFAHACGSDVVVARMFNLFAPGLPERLFVGRVERLIDSYRKGEVTKIEVGNLENRRDYVGADEAVAQVRAIAARGERGGIYHVASGKAVSMRELLHDMLDAAKIPHGAVQESTGAAGGRTGYDVPLICADMRRTRELLEAAG
jgi:GDP-4-dehydro-6-deoxy-D-mannose reductase